MAKIRCSNCEKSVKLRKTDGYIVEESRCKATGEPIPQSDETYYKIRKCDEFLPRLEYSKQFRTLFDKTMKYLAAGKEIKDIIK